jgi:hypothetical protein
MSKGEMSLLTDRKKCLNVQQAQSQLKLTRPSRL